jgi:hypothetical protein
MRALRDSRFGLYLLFSPSFAWGSLFWRKFSLWGPKTGATCGAHARHVLIERKAKSNAEGFQLAKLAAHRPGPRAAPPSHPTATGGAHTAICRPRGGFAKHRLLKKLEYQAKRACKKPSRQWVVGTQKGRSDYSCAFTRLR